MASRRVPTTLVSAALLLMAIHGTASAQTTTEPAPGMVITEDTTFEPGEYDFSSGDGITIAADGVTVDGSGAVLVGPGQAGSPDSFAGTGVFADGVSGVTVRGLAVRGFDRGMHVRSGSGWTIEDNDVSGNYTDPEFGWGDGPLNGGLLLERVTESTVAGNTGNENWNGLALHFSDDNRIQDNDFSVCSNVCLKLWGSSRNLVQDNDFSHGIRIDPGEVHARDSTSALFENGSNDNRVLGNDFTHGGDGIFLRPLNGVVSTGNYFERNDASYANNNAIESWDPGNTFVRNTVNHSSYGFWLGNSDRTVLIENEVAFNGRTNANAPEPFGNAGIAVVNGPGSHLVLDGNHVHDNTSVGIALGFRADYPVYHWIVQRNRIHDNTTHGIYLRDSRWITLGSNEIRDNGGDAIHEDANVSGVFELTGTESANAPEARIDVTPAVGYVGRDVTFDASASTDADGDALAYRWELGDGEVADEARVTHRYVDPGFYRTGVTVDDGGLGGIAHHDLYVLAEGDELGTEAADAAAWSVQGDDGDAAIASDTGRVLEGDASIRLSGTGGSATWRFEPGSAVDLSQQDGLDLWLGVEQETRDAFTATQPTVRLVTDADNYIELRPTKSYLHHWAFPYFEARHGWQRLALPFAGGRDWERTEVGDPSLANITAIELDTRATGGPYRVWVDSLKATTEPPEHDTAPNQAHNPRADGYPAPIASVNGPDDPAREDSDPWAPLDGDDAGPARWSSAGSDQATDFYGVDFGVVRDVDEVRLTLAEGPGLGVPSELTVEYWSGSDWRPVEVSRQEPASPAAGENAVAFDPVTTARLRVSFANPEPGTIHVGILELEAVARGNVAGNRLGADAPLGTPVPSASRGRGDVWSLVDGSVQPGRVWRSRGSEPYVEVDVVRPTVVNSVALYLGGASAAGTGIGVRYWTGSEWTEVSNAVAERAGGRDTVTFDAVRTRKLQVTFDPPGNAPVEVRELEASNTNLLSEFSPLQLELSPSASYTFGGDTVWGPLDGSYAAAPRWTSWNSMNPEDWYAVQFDRPVTASRVNLHVYDDRGGVQPAAEYWIEYWDGSAWQRVEEISRQPAEPAAGLNTITFEPTRASGFRFVGVNQNSVNFGVYVGLTEFELFR